jgi:hypothetical protein
VCHGLSLPAGLGMRCVQGQSSKFYAQLLSLVVCLTVFVEALPCVA